jgi:hypothetical protein
VWQLLHKADSNSRRTKSTTRNTIVCIPYSDKHRERRSSTECSASLCQNLNCLPQTLRGQILQSARSAGVAVLFRVACRHISCMTRAYQAADVVPTALSHLRVSRLEGSLSFLEKYYLPFYLVLYATFVYRGAFLQVHA